MKLADLPNSGGAEWSGVEWRSASAQLCASYLMEGKTNLLSSISDSVVEVTCITVTWLRVGYTICVFK